MIKIRDEGDSDDEYDNISIPFECSIPHKELEKFLKDTQKETEFMGNTNEDLRMFETFSPHTKEERKSGSNQKDINTKFLNQPTV
jgi:hypothetical protein